MKKNNFLYRFLYLYLYLLSLLLSFSPAYSQTNIAGKKFLYYPEHYNAPTDDDDKLPLIKSGEVQIGIPWIVWNDEQGNITYKEPGVVNVPFIKNLQFLEDFYVIKEKKDYLHIVKDSRFDAMSGILSNSAVDYGWIKKTDLLLWNRCLVTKRGNISRKAMLMNTQELIESTDLSKIKQNIVRFYKNAKRDELSDNQKNILDIFFIYKTKEKSVLLGVNSVTNKNTITSDILGWADKDRIINWDHRICIEPNFDPDAAYERKQTGFKTTVFFDVDHASKYSKGNNISAEGWWNADPFDNRLPGQMIRFPVYKIDTVGNTNFIVQMGMMGKVVSDYGEIEQRIIGKIKDENRELKYNRRDINIVFVIDGTGSMRPHFSTVRKATINSIKVISEANPDNKNNIRFAVVVYRDYCEGKYLTEIKPLASEKVISSYLENVFQDSKNRYNSDAPEAMYEGLKKALTSTGLENENTNIIFLIGDRGNHLDDKINSQQEIIDLLVQKYCHLFAFQVHYRTNDKSSKEFISQVSNIISEETKQIYYKTTNYNELLPPVLNNNDPSNIYIKNSAINAGIYSKKSMTNEELENAIVSSVKFINDFNTSLENKINRIVDNGESVNDVSYNDINTTSEFIKNINPENFSPSLYLYLTSLKMNEKNLEIIKNEKYQLYMTGATPLKIDGLKYKQYKFTLFLNQKELTDLVNIIEKLSSSVNAVNRRERMKNFFVELIKEHIGELSEDEQLRMDINKIWEKTTGLPFNSEILKKCTLAEITDELRFTDEQINKVNYIIQLKYNRLNDIVVGRDKAPEIVFETNNGKYFWIEEDLLP